MSGMTFREPLIFLSLGLLPCKWRVYLPVFTSRPLEDFGGVCGALCLIGESLAPYSAGGAGRGSQERPAIGPGSPRVPLGSGGSPGSPVFLAQGQYPQPLTSACAVPSSSGALPLSGFEDLPILIIIL